MPRPKKSENPLIANPAPLGLMGFGMTTVLLNLVNAGIIPKSGMGIVIVMGLFYGGMAQIIVGILEFKNGNTFGTVAFTSYGSFWLTLVGILVFPVIGWMAPVVPAALGAYFVMWGIFSGCMYVGTRKMNRGIQVVFSTLTILFFILAIAEFTGQPVITTIAGFEGILCGASAIYVAAAQVLNEVHKKIVLPIQ